jgi:hypothetical protein
MKVRLIFECSRCGSKYFRPSSKWTFRDTLLRKIGITPQRCFRCRRRFYLYRPLALHAFLKALAGPPEPQPQAPAARAAKAGHTPVSTDVVWSRFAEADQSERRS